MKIICSDRKKRSVSSAPEDRVISSVSADINRLLSPKTYEELCTLETQIRRKLDSNDPIDTDYWEQLLRSLNVWKARAKLKKVYRDVIAGRVEDLRVKQRQEAESVRLKLAPLAPRATSKSTPVEDIFPDMDPEPLLQLRPQDKGLEVLDEEVFLKRVVCFMFIFPTFLLIRPRLFNDKKSKKWDLYPSGSERSKSHSPRLLLMVLAQVYLRGLQPRRTMISRRPPKHYMNARWQEVLATTRRYSLAKNPLSQAFLLFGQVNTAPESPGTLTAFKWGMSGTNIIRPIMIMTIHPQKLLWDTNSTYSILI